MVGLVVDQQLLHCLFLALVINTATDDVLHQNVIVVQSGKLVLSQAFRHDFLDCHVCVDLPLLVDWRKFLPLEHTVHRLFDTSLFSVLLLLSQQVALLNNLKLLIGHHARHDLLHFRVEAVDIVLLSLFIVELWLNFRLDLIIGLNLFSSFAVLPCDNPVGFAFLVIIA